MLDQEDHDAVQDYARPTRRRADGDRPPGSVRTPPTAATGYETH